MCTVYLDMRHLHHGHQLLELSRHRRCSAAAVCKVRGRREEAGRKEGGRREEEERKEGGRREEAGRKEGGRREEEGRKLGGRR